MREEEVISGTPGRMDRGCEARHESDQPAATGVDARRTVSDEAPHGGARTEGCDARGPARPKAKDRDDSAGKRGRQKMARLVRMHGGLVIEGGR